MNKRIKIPFAWQKDVVVALCTVCSLLLMVAGCEPQSTDPKMDEETFFKNLASAPENKVPLETLPEWLQNEIKEFEAHLLPLCYLVAYRGEWEERVIYFLNHSFQSCYCDYRHENGEIIELPEDFSLKTKNWTLIYQVGDSPFSFFSKTRSFSDSRPEIKDKYEFPDLSGMNDWERPTIIQDRLNALQIPNEVF